MDPWKPGRVEEDSRRRVTGKRCLLFRADGTTPAAPSARARRAGGPKELSLFIVSKREGWRRLDPCGGGWRRLDD